MTSNKIFSILILESDPVIALDIAKGLEEFNFHIVGICFSSPKAKQILMRHRVDLLILDVEAHNINERINLVPQDNTSEQLELIILSSLMTPELIDVMNKLQPLDVILKPFTHRNLTDVVKNAWRKKHF